MIRWTRNDAIYIERNAIPTTGMAHVRPGYRMPVRSWCGEPYHLTHSLCRASARGRAEMLGPFFKRERYITMKLGAALQLRSENLRRIEELTVRAGANAQIQEGTAPAADPNELIAEIERLTVETTSLIQRINRTNVVTRLPNGTLVSDALAERDRHLALRNNLRAIAKAASEPQTRFLRSELRVVRTVDTAAILKRADNLAQMHRILDAAIQEANWTIDLSD